MSEQESFEEFVSEEQFLGKTVVIGVSYLENKKIIGRQQYWGKIVTFNDNDGLTIDYQDSGERYSFPPTYGYLKKVKPDTTFILRGMAELLENPDYLLTLFCTEKYDGEADYYEYDDQPFDNHAIDTSTYVEGKYAMPELDPKMGNDGLVPFESEEQFIGKIILIGVNYELTKSDIYRHQYWGTIKAFNDSDGLVIDYRNTGELMIFPPGYDAIKKARKDVVFHLRSTDEVLEEVDYLIAMSIYYYDEDE